MKTEDADLLLLKAASKSLAHHFKKAAAFHEAKATHHLKKVDAHMGMHEHHKAMMEDPAHEAHKEHHKAKAAYHKTLHGLHDKMHKAHTAHADHLKAMADAHAAGDPKKMLEICGLTEEALMKTETSTPAVTPAATATAAVPTTPPAAAATTPAATPDNLDESIKKAFDSKLQEAVNAALERLMASDDLNKKMDQIIGSKLLEKLGSAPLSTEIKTFPVPRKTDTPAPEVSKTVDLSGIEPDLAELCKVDQ